MEVFNKYLSPLFLTACLQGILLGIFLLIAGRKKNISKIILGILAIVFALDILYYVYHWAGWSEKYRQFNAFGEGFPLLYGPLIYLYVRTASDNIYYKKYWLHFIPFAVLTIYFIPFYLLSPAEKTEHLKNYTAGKLPRIKYILDLLQVVAKIISLFVYYFFLRKYSLAEIKPAINKNENEEARKNWLKKITAFYLFFSVAYLSYYVLNFAGLLAPAFDYTIAFFMAICIYLIVYHGIISPGVFEATRVQSKYERTQLTSEFIQKNKQRLLSVMELEKPHLKREVNIQTVAALLDISAHQLSQLMNGEFGQTFSDFMNDYRVEEAKRRLENPDLLNDKILKIALDSGFNNKVSFNAVFKKFTGVSPSEYRAMRFGKISEK